MSLYKLINILSVLAIYLPLGLQAGTLDSLVTDRNTKFQEFSGFKNNMESRTWINLVELGTKADAVIEADNILIRNILENEIDRNTKLSEQNEQLILEMAALKNEQERRQNQLRNHQKLNNLLLLVVLGLSLGFITSIILFIHHYRKYRHTRFELEQYWSMNDEQSLQLVEREKNLRKQIQLIEIENKAMQKEFVALSNQKTAAKNKLEEEINSRRKAEEEIRELIGQLKKH